MQRRVMLSLAGGAIAGGLLSTIDVLRRRVDSALALPTNVYDADEWERATDQYARLVGRFPTLDVIPQLLADLDEARLRTESSGYDTRPRMIRVCGLLSALAAICFVEIGHFLEASRYWRTAQRAAQALDDRQLHALIRGRRAVFALYGGSSPPEILQLADDTITLTDGAPSIGMVSAYAARAQVLAQQGNHSAARAALADVDAVFTQLPERILSVRESQWAWSEQRLRHVQSLVYSSSGRVADATQAQDAALALYPPSAWKASAQIQLHRAVCIIKSRDPSEGAKHALSTLAGLSPDRRNDTLIRHSAALVFAALPDSALRLPDVRQARELLASPSVGAI